MTPLQQLRAGRTTRRLPSCSPGWRSTGSRWACSSAPARARPLGRPALRHRPAPAGELRHRDDHRRRCRAARSGSPCASCRGSARSPTSSSSASSPTLTLAAARARRAPSGGGWSCWVGGIVLNGLAGALYIGSQFGPGPRDGLMTGLARRTGRSIRLVRTVDRGHGARGRFPARRRRRRRHGAVCRAHRPHGAAVPADCSPCRSKPLRAVRPPRRSRPAAVAAQGRRAPAWASGRDQGRPQASRARTNGSTAGAGLTQRLRCHGEGPPRRRQVVDEQHRPADAAERLAQLGADAEPAPHPGQPERAVAAGLARRARRRTRSRAPSHCSRPISADARGQRLDELRAGCATASATADRALAPSPSRAGSATHGAQQLGRRRAVLRRAAASRSCWPQPRSVSRATARPGSIASSGPILPLSGTPSRSIPEGHCARGLELDPGALEPAAGGGRPPVSGSRWGTTRRRTSRSGRRARRCRRRGDSWRKAIRHSSVCS